PSRPERQGFREGRRDPRGTAGRGHPAHGLEGPRHRRTPHHLGDQAMTGILDHVGISVTDFPRAMAFYTAALGTLGIKPLVQFDDSGKSYAAFGKDQPVFWVASGKQHRADG